MAALREIARTPTLLALKLRKLERQGRFNQALQDCLELEEGRASIPSLEEASPAERAELLLRYGALIGFLGHHSQIANSQEQSKDLLTRALAEFIALEDEVKVAECEIYMALAYWRTGELNEADVWLESAGSRRCPPLCELRISWYCIASLVNIERKLFDRNVRMLKEAEHNVLVFGDPYLSGIFYSNLGISYKDTGRTREALECFELARFYHVRSKHKIYRGTVENNIALLYRQTGDFSRAHEAIDNAIKIFKSAKDKTRAGYALDTKANIFLSEGNLDDALKTIDSSIDILKRGENAGYCVESILTRSKILLGLDRFADAVFSLLEAVEIQRVKVDENAARALVAEFEAELSKAYNVHRRVAPVRSDQDELQLLLPPPIGKFASYSAVRINNDHLEHFGLRKGSLAVFVDQEPKRGDLAAIEELKDGSVKCGLLDRDFGIVCLDRGDAEPELFNEDEIRILGTIIGFGNESDQVKGQVVVHPLTPATIK